MAQVYAFTDQNGETRLFAEIHPDPTGTPFNGGTITSALAIADPDPAATPLTVTLPVGTSSDGTLVFLVAGEGASDPLQLDAYGSLTLHADTVDATNGGGTVILVNAAGGRGHVLSADDGTGTSKAGFFGVAQVARPTVSGAKLPSDVVMASLLTALAALGLVIDSTT